MRAQAQTQQAALSDAPTPMETCEDQGRGYQVEATGALVSIDEAKARLTLCRNRGGKKLNKNNIHKKNLLVGCSGFGLGMPGAEQPVAFAFGASAGWHSFAVRLCACLCTRHRLSGLLPCPALPCPFNRINKKMNFETQGKIKETRSYWI